jgi:hypothetical protein
MRYPEDGDADRSIIVVERNKKEIATAHSKDEIRKATMQIIRSLIMLTNTLKVSLIAHTIHVSLTPSHVNLIYLYIAIAW